jgi:ketosteroid isomerase-like protein
MAGLDGSVGDIPDRDRRDHRPGRSRLRALSRLCTLEGTTEELNQTPANIWTVRDGKIARAEFYG